MMNLKTLSEKRYGTVPNALVAAVLAVGLIGFVNATFLTVKKFLGSPLTCYFFGGCDAVNASSYSYLFGLPLSLYGSVFYLLVVIAAALYLDKKLAVAIKALMILASMGFALSIYFLFLQQFVIKAYCFYCVVSAVSSTINFIIMLVIWKKYFSRPSSVATETELR